MNAQYVLLPVGLAAIVRDGRAMKFGTRVLKRPKRRSLFRQEERAIHKHTIKDITNELSSAVSKLDCMYAKESGLSPLRS